jgi:hypothetical protein
MCSQHVRTIDTGPLTGEADKSNPKEKMPMLVDIELRERLSFYCMVTRQRQEKAANLAIRELSDRCDSDPVMKERMDRARSLKEMLAAL